MWPATPASNTKGMVSQPKSAGYLQGVHELKVLSQNLWVFIFLKMDPQLSLDLQGHIQ